jgi:Ca2+-binding RTX toxin-like protein
MAIKHGTAGADTITGTADADQLFGEGGNDVLKGSAGPDTLDGGAGRDTADYSGAAASVGVNLDGEPGFTGFAGDADGDVYVSVGFENLIGSFGDDVLAGTLGANSIEGIGGADRLFGFAGDDLLRGRAGADTTTGGDGADLFFYDSAEDSPAGLFVRDVVLDFRHDQGDRIGLGPIDPFPGHAGDDAFEFLGKDALVDAPGQITYGFEGNTTVVRMNTVGGFDSPPEMEIQLLGNIDLVAGDFFL